MWTAKQAERSPPEGGTTKNGLVVGTNTRPLQRAPNLSAIGAFCIGTDQIDLSTCGAKGIAVFNAPYSNTRSVVEMALGEMILLLRGVFESSNRLHRGAWA